MANLTFPSNPVNGQTYEFNGKLFRYDSTTTRWSATRAQLLGALPDDITIETPDLTLDNTAISFSASGTTVYVHYTVSDDVSVSIANNGLANSSYAAATLSRSNNTITITSGTLEFSSANVVVTVTNNRTSNTASINLSAAYLQGLADPSSWTSVGSLTDATYMDEARDVVVDGNYAYVISKLYFSVVDISTPSSPTRVASLDVNSNGLAGNANSSGSLIKIGNYVYGFADSTQKIFSFNVSNPSSPSLQWSYNLGVSPGQIGNHINYDGNNHIYVVGQTSVFSFDISNPSSPSLADTITNTDVGSNYLYSCVTSELYGDYLIVVVAGVYRFTIIDVSNPASMSLHGTYAGPTYWGLPDGGGGNVTGSAGKDGIVYLMFGGGGSGGNSNLIQAWDFTSSLTSPTRVSWFQDNTNLDRPWGGNTFDVDYLYVSKYNGKITVVDTSGVSSNNITFVGESPAGNHRGCDIGGGYAISSDYSSDGIKIYS